MICLKGSNFPPAMFLDQHQIVKRKTWCRSQGGADRDEVESAAMQKTPCSSTVQNNYQGHLSKVEGNTTKYFVTLVV